MTDPLRHVRPELARPATYRWQDRIPPGRVSRFDMNTLALSPAWWPAIARDLARLPSCSYPEATYRPLREAIGTTVGIDWQRIVPGAGADEILLLAASLAISRGDRALVPRPAYQLYTVATDNAAGELEALAPVGPSGLDLDLDGILERAPGARLVWLCSPNNPTGEEVPAAMIADICRACPGLVVVDQAYLEFGGLDHAPLIEEHANLIVARTFSKAWGLAALRVGYGIASGPIAAALDALRPPGSLSRQSAFAAERACRHVEEMRLDADAWAAERQRLAGRLAALELDVLGQAGPFVLVRTPWSSEQAFDLLAAEGLIVRTLGDPALAGTFRASVATPIENDRLVEALARLLDRSLPPAGDAPARLTRRRARSARTTRETSIDLELALDGTGEASITTGVGFLDHMLTALAAHSLIDLRLTCDGDLAVDQHHTVEDCAIALGETLDQALGDRAGIRRFGSAAAPLDEALAHCVVDLSGRGSAQLELPFAGTTIGELPTPLVAHVFESFARAGRLTLHLHARGSDDHHLAEAAFKACALALRQAVEPDPRRTAIASTKGVL